MAINPIKTPFAKMSFTPDIPAAALGPNEYNIGLNVETDVRGIKKVYGEVDILTSINYEPIFITGGFRAATDWWFVVALLNGNWLGIDDTGTQYNFTPTVPEYDGSQYTQSTPITASWNGNVLFINDNINPPMYLIPNDNEIRLYDSNYIDQTPTTYTWNYYNDWADLRAGFLRVYSTPNIGSVLVCGNLTYTDTLTTSTVNLPNTIRWSQSFGLNSGPTTWEPTYTNVANEVDVPARGPIIDGFTLNGNFYLFSYWDCVIMTPIAYTASNAPVFGISPVTQGRGMLNENCFVINDSMAFGLDSSDIWMLNNGAFTEIGNQRVKNWFYDNLHPDYNDQVFMVNNTKKNQVEIYFPDMTSTGRCNKMLGYRYDLDIWNPPREVNSACMGGEAPYYNTTTNTFNIANRGVVYLPATSSTFVVQKDVGNGFFNGTSSTNINSYFQRDNINFGEPYSNKVQTHRVLPEVNGTGTITISVGGSLSAGQVPQLKTTSTIAINTDYPWIQPNQNSWRMTSMRAGSNDSTGTWIITQANWQVTIVEDDR